MKLYYETHSSTSWADTRYWLCDTEEEYQAILAKEKAARKKIEDQYNALPPDADFRHSPAWNYRWMYNNWTLGDEGPIQANEYYYGHEWCGKHFSAFGFCVHKVRELSTHTDYYMKPSSINCEGEDESVGQFTGYGS